MTAAKYEDIARITAGQLAECLPDGAGIRRGRKGNLYLSTPYGAWYLNTPNGQRVLLGLVGEKSQESVAANDDVYSDQVEEVAPLQEAVKHPPRKMRVSLFDVLGEFD